MAIDPKNIGNLTCGLVADPEVINTSKGGQIVKLRVAADYAGSEGGKASTGYFDVTFFPRSDDQQSSFVMRQINEGKMKKGSQVQIVYRLNNERFEHNGEKRQKVTLVAESLTYAGGSRPEGGSSDSNGASSRREAPAEEQVDLPSRW